MKSLELDPETIIWLALIRELELKLRAGNAWMATFGESVSQVTVTGSGK